MWEILQVFLYFYFLIVYVRPAQPVSRFKEILKIWNWKKSIFHSFLDSRLREILKTLMRKTSIFLFFSDSREFVSDLSTLYFHFWEFCVRPVRLVRLLSDISIILSFLGNHILKLLVFTNLLYILLLLLCILLLLLLYILLLLLLCILLLLLLWIVLLLLVFTNKLLYTFDIKNPLNGPSFWYLHNTFDKK